MLNRRRFLGGLFAAPFAAKALKEITWEEPAAAFPADAGLGPVRAGIATAPARSDHVHPITPPGTIIPFNGHNIPEGWLLCDGRMVSVKEYPALYEAIGQRYGASYYSHEFRLPDMRGHVMTQHVGGNHNHSHSHGPQPSSHNHTWGEITWYAPAYHLIKT